MSKHHLFQQEVVQTPEVTYEDIDIRKLTKCDVNFWGENHTNLSLFQFIAKNAKEMKESGINAFCIEADSSQDFGTLNEDNFSEIETMDLGPTLDFDLVKEARLKMVKALVNAGIHIIPINQNANEQSPADQLPEEEKLKAINILKAKDEYGKVIVLIGTGHCSRSKDSTIFETERKEAIRFIEEDHGIKCQSIFITGGESLTRNLTVSDLIFRHQINRPIMFKPSQIDLQRPFMRDQPDIIVHFPEKILLGLNTSSYEKVYDYRA